MKDSEFQTLTGVLFAGQTPKDDPRYTGSDGDDLRDSVVFDTGEFEILFRSSIGPYFVFRDQHFTEEDGELVYYPYHNETIVEVDNSKVETEDMEVAETEVSLRYRILDDSMYLQSQCEVTAYSPVNMTINGEVYAVQSTYMKGEKNYEEDPFLGIDATDNAVPAKNLRTGFKSPVDVDKVRELQENDDPNGALEVRDPQRSKSKTEQLIGSLQ